MPLVRISILLAIVLWGGLAGRAQSITPPLSATRPTPRVFLLPTANAIGAGHGFLGDYELFALYGGFGIGDIVSVTAGTTLVPMLNFGAQLSTMQVKATFLQDEGIAFATGASLSFITSANRYTHLFLNGSLLVDSTWYTVAVYYRIGGPEMASVDVAPFGNFAFSYIGSLGIGLGAEIPIRNRPDMHVIAEIWNHDVSSPRHTAVMAGLRIGNEMLSGSFGLMFTPVPFVFPVASFAYEW